jgi:hypothetical protein
MDAWVWVAIAVAVVVVVVVAWAIARKRRSDALKQRFGPEYDHAVIAQGGQRGAEAELQERVERRESLDIGPLSKEMVVRYRGQWRNVQAKFVDEPVQACAAADTLITSVMRDRGYPMDDFELRSADVSVDHPDVVSDYRAAHTIALANANGAATTEDLRQAMIHYRALFDQLVESGAPVGDRGGQG